MGLTNLRTRRSHVRIVQGAPTLSDSFQKSKVGASISPFAGLQISHGRTRGTLFAWQNVAQDAVERRHQRPVAKCWSHSSIHAARKRRLSAQSFDAVRLRGPRPIAVKGERNVHVLP